MSLNPITALSEQLQKLINEHGSAAILRDHLALFKDQVLLLEKENTRLITENVDLAAKVTVLQSEKEVLETKANNLTKDNKELRGKIQEYEHPTHKISHSDSLDDQKVNILKLLFKQDNLQPEQIAQHLNLELQTAKYHLEELKTTMKMIKQCIVNIPREETNDYGTRHWHDQVRAWSLEQKGRKFLIENSLIE
jgi:hypothetical protein